MPRDPQPLIRKSGFLQARKLFVLAYEGEVTEKKYFEDLRHSECFNDNGIIEIISLGRSQDQGNDPFSVKKLLVDVKSEYHFKATDEFWLIIDRDHWETNHRHSFDKLAAGCRAEVNVFMAMSNPCFEIWLLLHLRDLSSFSEDERNHMFENKRVSRSKTYTERVLGNLLEHGYNKRPDPRVFMPKVYKAITNAKTLNVRNEDYPKALGTHVYKLVEKLVK